MTLSFSAFACYEKCYNSSGNVEIHWGSLDEYSDYNSIDNLSVNSKRLDQEGIKPGMIGEERFSRPFSMY